LLAFGIGFRKLAEWMGTFF